MQPRCSIKVKLLSKLKLTACELIDFWKFNAYYAREFHEQYQPLVSPEGNINTTEIRPLEGCTSCNSILILQVLLLTYPVHQPW